MYEPPEESEKVEKGRSFQPCGIIDMVMYVNNIDFLDDKAIELDTGMEIEV